MHNVCVCVNSIILEDCFTMAIAILRNGQVCYYYLPYSHFL